LGKVADIKFVGDVWELSGRAAWKDGKNQFIRYNWPDNQWL